MKYQMHRWASSYRTLSASHRYTRNRGFGIFAGAQLARDPWWWYV